MIPCKIVTVLGDDIDIVPEQDKFPDWLLGVFFLFFLLFFVRRS